MRTEFIALLLFFTLSLLGDDFNRCYVTYNNREIDDQTKFIIYVQNNVNPIYYFGFEITHDIDTSEQVYSNQFRLKRAFIYVFNGKKMRSTGLVALAPGESECVYKALNAIDFTGGFHGDEKLIEINFYIDGIQLSPTDLSESFYLRPCSAFSYIQKSSMHKTPRKNDPQDFDHKIEAIHFKNTTFNNSGYTTYNTIEWCDNIPIEIGYMSISAIGIDMGEFGQSDKYQVCKFNRASDHKLKEINNNVHLWNEANSTYAKVKSEFNISEDSAIQFVWDVINYNKYYRNIVTNAPINVTRGDIWNSTTMVEFGKQ
ncbi:hypothetical protein [Mariniphaga sediminis]|uniref:hypothetical protein n=1 Tax=Mariniphaga sediminis TaxID=1628158 RepID=UPI00356B27D7